MSKKYRITFYFINKVSYSTCLNEIETKRLLKIIRKEEKIVFGPATDTNAIHLVNMKYVNLIAIKEVKDE